MSKLHKEIKQRGEGKIQAITQTEVQFNDPEMRSLLALVPLAYDKMAQLPFDQYGETHKQIKESVHRVEAILEQLKFVQEAGDGLRHLK